MDLQSFYPYQLVVLAEAVSQAMAQVYAVRFDLSRDEWRLVAGLAELGPTRTTELMAYSTLQKMPEGLSPQEQATLASAHAKLMARTQQMLSQG